MERMERVGRTIQMRRRRSDRKGEGPKRFNPDSIEAGDWIMAADEGWALRVVGVSRWRKRRWSKGGALASHPQEMTIVELAGCCRACDRLHVFRRALANIRGPVVCVACKDRRRERRELLRDQRRAYAVVRMEAVLDGWDFGLGK